MTAEGEARSVRADQSLPEPPVDQAPRRHHLGTLYHVGHVVDDLRAGMDMFSTCFGTRWAVPRRLELAVVVDGELRSAELFVTYSMQPPYTELFQELQGSQLDAAGLRLDHAGYYVEDVETSAQMLIARGIPQRVQVLDPGGQAVQASMHQLHDGTWIELVNASFEGQLDDWIRATLNGTAPPTVWPG